MPVTSPAAYTPGVLVSCDASTTTASPSWVSLHPAATANSNCGVNPKPTHTASHSIRRSEPTTGFHPESNRTTVTASTRSVPCAATTVHPCRSGTRCRASVLAYPANSNTLPIATITSGAHPRRTVDNRLASNSPTTDAPTPTSDSATGSRNGPVPATTTRRPTAIRCPFANAC